MSDEGMAISAHWIGFHNWVMFRMSSRCNLCLVLDERFVTWSFCQTKNNMLRLLVMYGSTYTTFLCFWCWINLPLKELTNTSQRITRGKDHASFFPRSSPQSHKLIHRHLDLQGVSISISSGVWTGEPIVALVRSFYWPKTSNHAPTA